jgi:signal transduction histidine kinase/ActR/RegA family two-component response regulator
MSITLGILGWCIALVSFFLWIRSKREVVLPFRKGQQSTDRSNHTVNQLSSDREKVQDSIIYFASSLFRQNTVEDILWDVSINCIDKLGFEDCVIYLVDEDKQVLVQKAAFGPKNDNNVNIVDPIEIPIGSGIVGSVFASGNIELVSDLTKDDRYIVDDAERMSELAIPLITPEGKVLGVIDSEHHQKDFFTSLHVTVLSTIASICAIKLVKAQADKALLQAKDEAEAASKVKSQFLSTMSHEIRNPLNAVIGMSHLLMQDNPSEEQMEHLKPLHLSSKHLLALVNDILDYSRLESGKVKLVMANFNLEDLFKDMSQNYAFLASQKGLMLEMQIEKYDYLLKGDALRINQVLNNIIGNAIKFTESGKVVIGNEIVAESDDSCKVRFFVKDTGLGVSEADKQKVFLEFEQVKGGSNRQYEGAGLGLAICQQLVEIMGGTIGVNSTLGSGSEFWFTITFERGPIIQDLPQASSASWAQKELPGMRILLVEDHIVNQKIISKLTQKWKIELAIAENGSEAIDIVKNDQNFDLILMDLHMPEVGGVEATKRIRALEDDFYHEVPIIALTADVSSDIIIETESSGMNDFITKPFHPHLLFDILSKFYNASNA